MSDAEVLLRDHLAYVEGARDAIDGLPNAKQWARITDRIDRLKAALDQPQPEPVPTPIEVPQVQATSAPAPAALTPGTWKTAVYEALITTECMDNDSAADAMADHRFCIDLTVEPSAMASRVAAGNY